MPEDLIIRTKRFALAVIKLCAQLPNRPEGWVLGKQLLRSGTSIGANYREAQRARTRQEFMSKIQICRQEIEETLYWLELIHESGLSMDPVIDPLHSEALQLQAIFTSIAKSPSN